MTTKMKKNLHIHLPEDVIVNNILCRLPVKSLHRFRCVSKRWRCIISDTEFARSHFKMSSEQGTLCRRHLVSLTSHQLGSFDFETPSLGKESLVRNLTFPSLSKFNQPDLLGSCNGFVFVAVNYYLDLYLWNPSTTFVRKIPSPDLVTKSRSPLRVDFSIYGMGYVSATDDYKLFVAGYEGVEDSEWESEELGFDHMEVFSLRSNCWKSIEAPEPEFKVSEGLGVLTNEALHWDYRKKVVGKGEEQCIVAFDLATEEFRWVPLPILGEDDKDIDRFYNEYVGKFICLETHVFTGGCLGVSFLRDPRGDRSKHFWVMREYGVRHSWTMLFKFNVGDIPARCFRNPIFVTESGMIVFRLHLGFGDELVRIEGVKEGKVVFNGRYDLSLNESQRNMFDMILYHETLLSLPE